MQGKEEVSVQQQQQEEAQEEVEYLCVWAWKRRGGWAGGVLGSGLKLRQWEYRSIVVVGHVLQYYEMGTEDSETPRGTIDLWNDQVSVQVVIPDETEKAPTRHFIVIQATKTATTTTTTTNPAHAPTTTHIEWKLCFDQQQDMVRLISVVNKSLEQGGAFRQKDVNRFEHDFAIGDHIYRWEMIVCPPVIYPIQIHAIVLSAGRNCLVVADFGLTGYAKKKDAHFHHAEDNEQAVQQQILAAFRKLRPTDATQRLNIVTLTDQREIRKWFKAGYDEESMLAKAKAATGGHHHLNFGKMFSKRSPGSSSSSGSSPPVSPPGKAKPKQQHCGSATSSPTSAKDKAGHQNSNHGLPPAVPLKETQDWPGDAMVHCQVEGPSPPSSSSSSPLPTTTSSLSTSEHHDETTSSQTYAKQVEKLPHSDPVEIVLARANFCLENIDLLPPYHVFFSNSECIAVWCKTGRWSTLQTAVWCSTNSMGALKTSTLTTIGVAAANPLLAPVIAIGGLLWVSAPMLILQKSREAWEEYTEKMTNLFWAWAPNAVFVSAVENWTTILKLREEEHVGKTHVPASPPSAKKLAVVPSAPSFVTLEDEKKAADDTDSPTK